MQCAKNFAGTNLPNDECMCVYVRARGGGGGGYGLRQQRVADVLN